jgi:cytochrome c553
VLISLGTFAALIVLTGIWWASTTIRPAQGPPATDVWDSGIGAAEGREVFASCASCHLADAMGRSDGTIPRLAGQSAAILSRKLRRIASGEVDLPVMTAFARALSDSEIDAVASWLAALPGAPVANNTDRGAELYAQTCIACHGPSGEGNDALGAPRLSGQHAPYLVRRMEESVSNARGDADPVMAVFVTALSPADREAIAVFLAGVTPPEVP